MAIIAPNSYFAGLKLVTSNSDGSADPGDFSNSVQYICIPLTSLPELTALEAHPSDGDIRKFMFAFETAAYLAYEGKAVADRPARWISSRTEGFNSGGITLTRYFNHQITTGISGEEVIAEPS
jgi:hypothetical protein